MSDTSCSLFPPYMERGSAGGAVDMLHMLLDGFGFGKGIVPDLEYGEVTEQRVRELQGWLGVEQDGKFGPGTRTALYVRTTLDVEKITWAPQNGFTTWVHDGKIQGRWPQAEE